MARKLPTIPRTTRAVPKAIADILTPMREILEARFQNNQDNEQVVTRKDLIELGLATQDDINKLGSQ